MLCKCYGVFVVYISVTDVLVDYWLIGLLAYLLDWVDIRGDGWEWGLHLLLSLVRGMLPNPPLGSGSGWRLSFVCVVFRDTWDGYIFFVINYLFFPTHLSVSVVCVLCPVCSTAATFAIFQHHQIT